MGIDPDHIQWNAIIDLCVRRGLRVIFDIAYQGFCSDPEDDTWPIRYAQKKFSVIVINSYAKKFSIYGERVDAVSVSCTGYETKEKINNAILSFIKTNYFGPPKDSKINLIADSVSSVLNKRV